MADETHFHRMQTYSLLVSDGGGGGATTKKMESAREDNLIIKYL